MAQAERRADVVWKGELTKGEGSVTAGSSGAFKNLEVTWASRTEKPDGKTSPEELLAASHATCYAMAFSYALSGAGHAPDQLNVSATVGLDPKVGGGFEVSISKLDVRGRVPGLDQATFERLAGEAEQGCPISNALRGNVQIELHATLE